MEQKKREEEGDEFSKQLRWGSTWASVLFDTSVSISM